MSEFVNWKIDENEELPLAIIEDTEDGFGICELEAGVDMMKNARLMVAAPKLLEACGAMAEYISEQWLKEWDNRPNCLRMSEDAIAKVEKG